MSVLLALRGVTAFYGAVQALRGVELEVRAGEIVALIGANGAGKSTLMGAICGDPRPRDGAVWFDGEDLVGEATHRIVRRGIALVPEGRHIFPRMTVRENLLIGAQDRTAAEVAASVAQVQGLFPRLAERAGQRGGTLSGGEQQMLAIGRALMSRPRLLLLDEPSLGLAPLMVRQIFAAIRALNEGGLTVLLVEQNAHQALRLADRAYVLVNGTITMAGSAAELRRAPEVQEAYLNG